MDARQSGEVGLGTRLAAGGDGTELSLKPSDLPSPPQATARVIQACSDPNIGAQGLAQIVASDPVLTAELLRVVNSAFFGLKREVRSAVQAVTILGNRALRNLALCLAVRDSVRPGAIPGFDVMSFWEEGLRRAVSAKLIARSVGFDPDEAFTIGLLQDFGMLALVFARPQLSPCWNELRVLTPDERRRQEQLLFGTTHDRIGLVLAKTWSLPPGIALAMACHHAPDADGLPPHHREACRIAHVADQMAAVFSCTTPEVAITRCRAAMAESFAMSADDADAVLAQVPSGVEEAAVSLGLRVATQLKYDEVMRLATQTLVAENRSYQELTRALEQALREKDALAQRLQEANRQLEQLAYYDALTDLVNRRRFTEVLSSEVARHSRSGASMTLVMVDLDHFKSVNDTYGHPFGDQVLVAVAGVLREALRQTDVKARVGGEEICLLLPETGEEAAKAVVERARLAIESLALRTPQRRVPVTASFGACSWSGRALDRVSIDTTCSTLLETADQALYDSKRAGRNRVSWRKFPAPPS
jgi:diguanylate cyclase (GGDEF)-like protein